MLKNGPCAQSNNMRTVLALSDLGFFNKLIELVQVALRAVKFFALKLDLPNEFARIFRGRYVSIKFVGVEVNILHPESYTSDLSKWERF